MLLCRSWSLLRSLIDSRQVTYRSVGWRDIHRKLDREVEIGVFEVDTVEFSGTAHHSLKLRIQQLASSRQFCESSLAASPTRHARACRSYASLAVPNRSRPHAGSSAISTSAIRWLVVGPHP